MKFTKETFIPYAKQSIKQCGESTPSVGRTCIIGSLRYVRDQLIAAAKTKGSKFDIKVEMDEMITQWCSKDKSSWPESAGFASNASAMAKACGYKETNTAEQVEA